MDCLSKNTEIALYKSPTEMYNNAQKAQNISPAKAKEDP